MNILMSFSVIFVLISLCKATKFKRGYINDDVVLLNFNNEQVPIVEPNQSNLIPQNSLDTTSGSGVELGPSTSINYQNQQIQQPQLPEKHQVQQVQLAETRNSLNLPTVHSTQSETIDNQQTIQTSSISTQQSPKERTIQDSIFESIQAGNRILNGQIIFQQSQSRFQAANLPHLKTTIQTPQIHTITKQVPVIVPQPYPVEVIREVKVPVHVRIPVQVPKPYEVKVPHPVPVPVTVRVPIEVPKPYPVTVTKTVHVPVERIVYVQIPQPIKFPVPEPYPVPVPQPVQVQVPTPVVINDNGTPVNGVNNGENVADDSVVVEASNGPQYQGSTALQSRSKAQDSNNQQENVVPIQTINRPLFKSSQQVASNQQLIRQNEQNYLPQIPQIYQVNPQAYAQSKIYCNN